MKKALSFILSIVLAFAVLLNGTAAFAKTAGDINGDGTVTSADALLALTCSIGKTELTAEQLASADLNGDGAVNSADALAILKICVGKAEEIRIDFSEYPSLDEKWMQTVVDNYKEFSAEVGSDGSKIPFIVSTDQHGSVKADSEVFRFINDLVDWDGISKIINLGDTVELLYSDRQLKAYNEAMQYIPVEKRLEIEGNHDAHLSLIHRDMSRYFPASGAVYSANKDAFVVNDYDFGVRYLAVDPMGYPWTYTSGRISTEQADFIIAELEKNAESDIVLLSHTYLFRDALIKRDGTTFTGSDYFIGSEKKNADIKQSFVDMLTARKNKTAGVFVDSDGVEHPYDFSGCKGQLLMSLHGHHHTEGYQTDSGITEFLFQSFRHNGSENDDEPNCFYFAYIDRENGKFKCWKNIEGYSAWEIDIA